MTYCIGVMLDKGIIFASDSRTNAGVDNFAKFCKMTVFERPRRPRHRAVEFGESGRNPGHHQRVDAALRRGRRGDQSAGRQDDVRRREVGRGCDARNRATRRRATWKSNKVGFNASFIVGGQIAGEPMRLFRTYAEGNFIEAGTDTLFLQTGETKYGKPILDRVLAPDTSLADATKCVLVSFDSTMRSNLSVGMPIDLVCYERDSLEVQRRRRFDEGDPYFTAVSQAWGEGTRQVFSRLPELRW